MKNKTITLTQQEIQFLDNLEGLLYTEGYSQYQKLKELNKKISKIDNLKS